MKPWMLPGPHYRGLTTSRTVFICSVFFKLIREQLGSRPTFLISRRTAQACILYQVCDARWTLCCLRHSAKSSLAGKEPNWLQGHATEVFQLWTIFGLAGVGHGCCSVQATGDSLPCGRYFSGNSEESKSPMIIQSRNLANNLYTPVDSTSLQSIPKL